MKTGIQALQSFLDPGFRRGDAGRGFLNTLLELPRTEEGQAASEGLPSRIEIREGLCFVSRQVIEIAWPSLRIEQQSGVGSFGWKSGVWSFQVAVREEKDRPGSGGGVSDVLEFGTLAHGF